MPHTLQWFYWIIHKQHIQIQRMAVNELMTKNSPNRKWDRWWTFTVVIATDEDIDKEMYFFIVCFLIQFIFHGSYLTPICWKSTKETIVCSAHTIYAGNKIWTIAWLGFSIQNHSAFPLAIQHILSKCALLPLLL